MEAGLDEDFVACRVHVNNHMGARFKVKRLLDIFQYGIHHLLIERVIEIKCAGFDRYRKRRCVLVYDFDGRGCASTLERDQIASRGVTECAFKFYSHYFVESRQRCHHQYATFAAAVVDKCSKTQCRVELFADLVESDSRGWHIGLRRVEFAAHDVHAGGVEKPTGIESQLSVKAELINGKA